MIKMVLNHDIRKFCVLGEASLKKALLQLNDEKLRLLLCLDKSGRLVGTFTPGDMNRWLISDGVHSLELPVLVACQRNPITVSKGKSPREIQSLLNQVAYIPVLEQHQRPIA